MFSRIVPLIALFCIFAVALSTYLVYRSAEQEQREHPQTKEVPQGEAAQVKAQLELAKEYALQAEAAAARAQTALDAVMQIEAKLRAAEKLPAQTAETIAPAAAQ